MDSIANVTDRKSFIAYIEWLRKGFATGDIPCINFELTDFLDAMNRYADNIDGYYDNAGQQISTDQVNWKVLADLITGASVY